MAEYKNVSEELDALINGTLVLKNEVPENTEEEEAESTVTDEVVEEKDETEVEEKLDINNEDTEQTEAELEETDTTNVPDGEDDEETVDIDEEKDAENAPVEEDSAEDAESTDTEEVADVTTPETTDTIDYKDFYEKLTNAEFKANGKTVKGINDVDKLIQVQQMAHGLNAKNAGFKPYRPYMGAIKDRGMIDDPAKFDLAMSIMDGDVEALKTHIENLKLDPLDLDMENIEYKRDTKIANNDVMVIEDALETAKEYGVEEQVYNAVIKEWDETSFQQFVKNPYVRDDLIKHMSDGSYDIVMDRVKQLEILDDKYASLDTVTKYQTAVKDINTETARSNTPPATVQKPVAKQPESVNPGIKEEQQYKAKVIAKKNKVAAEARKKASTVSKSTQKSSKPKTIDPMNFNGEEISKYLDKMIMGKK